jgi:hypothetical protein
MHLTSITLRVLDDAIAFSKQRIILATTYVLSWMEVCSTLTDENVTGSYRLASKTLAS